MRSTRRPARLAIVLAVVPLTLAACGGSSGGSAESTTTAPNGGTGVSGQTMPPPALPFALGTRGALGDWELAVDAATPGTTTTISGRLRNVSGKAVPAPPTTVFTLKNGVLELPVPAQVTGLPATVPAGVDVPITITFVGTTAPADPYLHWGGTKQGAIEASFKLTPGEPTVPVD